MLWFTVEHVSRHTSKEMPLARQRSRYRSLGHSVSRAASLLSTIVCRNAAAFEHWYDAAWNTSSVVLRRSVARPHKAVASCI